MFSGGLAGKGTVADQALAHVLIEGDEHLPNPVGTGVLCTTARLVVNSHRL
jgi:hypothetical protein